MSDDGQQAGSGALYAAVNVVLTGFMGTGKSTVGRLLARRLGYEFVDTDHVIESRHGPIGEIFATEGESAFRAIERAVAAELGERTGLVIATGGRLLLDPANETALLATGRAFCLVAPPDEIVARVVDDQGRIGRPLLDVEDPASRVRELLAERAAGYGRFEAVETSGRSPGDVVDDIVARLGTG